jgi:hypothetical protein
MRDDHFVNALRAASTRDEIWRLLDEPAGGWQR